MTYMTIEQFRQIHEDWKQIGLSVRQYRREQFLLTVFLAIRRLATFMVTVFLSSSTYFGIEDFLTCPYDPVGRQFHSA